MIQQKFQSRRLIAALLSMLLLISTVPPVFADTDTQPRGLTLEEMMEKFPDGKYWNGGDPDGWTETPCTHHGSCYTYDGRCGCNSFMGQSIQCMGFAEKLGYDATGFNPRQNENGWVTYKSVSALNNLKAGDIVRRNGHSMYVIAVDGQVVTIADCNSMNRSCNIRWGGITTKSDLSYSFEHVRSAPTPLITGYNDLCQRFASNGTATVNSETILYSSPCTTEIQSTSLPVTTAPAGSQWQVTKLYLNTQDEYWYRTEFEGTACYFLAGDSSFSGKYGNIFISDAVAPVNTQAGRGFPIGGVVSSDTLSLAKVGAYIYEGSEITDTPYMISEDTPAGKYSYSISGSSVDNDLTFGKLPAGSYTYAIRAWVTNHYAADGTLATDTTAVLLYQSTFAVTETLACSHSFEPVPEDGSFSANRCTKCGYSYTVAVYATDYMTLCQRYLSHGSAIAYQETALYSLPCTFGTHSRSYEVTTAPQDSRWEITGLYQNAAGQYWYQTAHNSTVCYLYAGDALFFPENGSISIGGVSAPIHTWQGSGYPIKGQIISDTLPLTQVGAYIYQDAEISDTPYLSSEAALENIYSYELYQSAVDSKLTFGKLPAGNYTYIIKAQVINHHANGGVLSAAPTDILLYQSTFTVSKNISCTHTFDSTETLPATCIENGLITYTCSKCKYTYTVTAFATGIHTYGPWKTVTPPTYSVTGQQAKICIHCGDIQQESIPMLESPFKRWGITLGENIGIRIQLNLDDTDIVSVTVNGTEADYTADDENIIYIHVAAAQMNDPIVVYVNGLPLPNSFSVRSYADKLLNGNYGEDMKELVRSMLVYGSAAQRYFAYNTDALADDGIRRELPVPTGDKIMTTTGAIDGVLFYGATLLHQTKTAVRFYFLGSVEGLTFTINGNAAIVLEEDGMHYVDIGGINPQDFDKEVAVTVSNGTDTMTVRYTPLTYMIRSYNKADSSTEQKELVQAMYGYYIAAKNYTE